MTLIDADALKDRLQALAYDDWNQGVCTSWADAYREVAEMVEDQPTIEAVPVKHGRWETADDGVIYCSCCEDFWDSSLERIIKIRFEYCPYCGAHMEGAEDD